MFIRSFVFFIISIFSSNLFALVKIESIKQSGLQDRGSVRVYLSSPYDIKKTQLMYGDDYVEILIPDSFIIPATKKIFKPSSAKSSVSRIEAELLNGTKVSVKIFFKTGIDLIKNTAELKQLGRDIVFSYSTKLDSEPKLIADLAEDAESISTENNVKEIKKETNKEELISKPSSLIVPEKKTSVLEKENKTAAKDVKEFNFFWSFLKMLMALVFLIGIFILGAYLVKKYLKTPISLYGRVLNDPNIKIEHKLGLELGKNLYIIRVEGERHLIGSSKEAITYLSRLKDNPLKSDFEEKVQKNSILLANSENKIENEEKLKSRLKDRIKDKRNL